MTVFRMLWVATALITVLRTVCPARAEAQPNVLWILTDDQRYDSIRAFNRMLHGREMSQLGYVESPQTDRLASMGATFINTYCQAMGCAPSRASMHYGRYPFRSGPVSTNSSTTTTMRSIAALPCQSVWPNWVTRRPTSANSGSA